MRRLAVLLVLVLSLAPAARADAPGFTTPAPLPNELPSGQWDGAEPGLAFDADGDHLYVVAPNGGTAQGGVNLWASADGGRTFPIARRVGNRLGGSDADVEVGIDHTVYVGDLETVAAAICRSHDFGATFEDGCQTGLGSDQQGVLADREWISHDPRRAGALYLTYHDLALQLPIIERSTDGGSSFLPCGLLLEPGTPALTSYNPVSGTDVGKPVVAPDGSIYVPIAESTGPPNPAARYDALYAAVAEGGCSGLTGFHDHTIYQHAGADLSNIFASMAMDGGGWLYTLAAGRLTGAQSGFGVYLFVSRDRGRTWSAPIQVNTPDLTDNVLPALAAGSHRGELAIGWMGSSTATDPNDPRNRWRYQAALSDDAGQTFRRATLSPDPLHYGQVCTLGILCGSANRNLLDFSSVAINPVTGCAAFAIPADPYNNNPSDAMPTDNGRASAFLSVQRPPCGPPAACADAGRPASRITRIQVTGSRLRLAGTARDRGCAGLARVEVSVARRSGGRCAYLRRAGGLGAPRSCASPVFVRARGRARWRLTAGRLPAGSYLVRVRARDAAGHDERIRRAGRRSVRIGP